MLVLSRKKGEEIVVGENIRIVVSAIAGNRVRIGIQAPDDVDIRRGELLEFTTVIEADNANAQLELTARAS